MERRRGFPNPAWTNDTDRWQGREQFWQDTIDKSWDIQLIR